MYTSRVCICGTAEWLSFDNSRAKYVCSAFIFSRSLSLSFPRSSAESEKFQQSTATERNRSLRKIWTSSKNKHQTTYPIALALQFFLRPSQSYHAYAFSFFYLSLNPLAGSFRYFQPALDQSIYFVMFSLIFIVPIIRIRRSLTFLLAIKIEDKIQNHWYGEHMKKTLRISIDEILE